MLSRSNSTAGERLRRAKSTSSHHTTSSGHSRTQTNTDPFVIRQHAEAAAVEAYHRARQTDEPTVQSYRPVPPKLQRRRSQATGRTEGSHLEDARLGRRRSTSTRSESKPPQALRTVQPTVSEYTGDSAGEEKVIVRKRSVIPPSLSTRQSQQEYLTVPSTSHHARKPQSVYVDGSPTPRHAGGLKERSSTLQLNSTPSEAHTDGYGGNLANLSDFGEPTTRSLNSQRPSIRETQTDNDILALARDKCLQDFHQKKIRERKSFILAPFQKRMATAFLKSSDNSYDNTLPPFNYADDTTLAPLPPAPEPLPCVPLAPEMKADNKRHFSDTLKGRIKKAFRKASRAPTGLPAQHVEARYSQYPTDVEVYRPQSERDHDPFITVTTGTPVASSEAKSASGNSRISAAPSSETRSRVTSWTNSTIAGTCASRAENEHMPSITEQGGLVCSSSQRTLRKASSFFGRTVKNKLRKPSKAQLSSSEESQGLYSALRERIGPSTRIETPEVPLEEEQSLRSRVPSALSTLPSQQRVGGTASGVKRYTLATIRTITPDPAAYKLGICSPVPEVRSPDDDATATADFAASETDGETPRTLLQRRAASKAPALSQEQLQRRMEKSKNRWQGPLDELSPHPARAEIDENPYELRSLSQSHQQPPLGNDLPYHANVGVNEQIAMDRTAILSPSVYSRATDGVSPRPVTPAEQAGGMVVRITGREVRSYSISPPKQEHPSQRPAQTSGQWRRWLSDEMHSIKAAQEDFSLAQAFLSGSAAQRSRSNSRQEGMHLSAALRSTSISPPVDARPISAAASNRPTSASTIGRPRANSRRSSFMNERYPMMDTSRNSSDQSVRSRNMTSRQGDYASSGEEKEKAVRPSTERQARRSFAARPRVVTGRASIAQMERTAREAPSFGGTRDAGQTMAMGGEITHDNANGPAAASTKASLPSTQRPKTSGRAKSALDMRASYTNNTSGGRSTPIEIRRKPNTEQQHQTNIHFLGDSTIRNISAGPYASHQFAPQQVVTSAATRTENTPPSRSTAGESNKENTPPPASEVGVTLPALSSSEWLAAGPNKSRRPSTVHPAYRNRSVSRYSPPKSREAAQYVGKADSGKGSPAQRMASEWLEKRSRDSTPAFM